MDKNIGLYLNIAGIVTGVVAGIILFTVHTGLAITFVIGAALYFAGELVKRIS